MRRSLALLLALVGTISAQAMAQTCLGLSSFSNRPVQLSGDASLEGGASAIGAGVAYGISGRGFGQLTIGTRARETFEGSSLDLGAAAGYQIPVGRARQFGLCPIGSVGLERGPRNSFGSGVDRSRRSAQLGLALGASLGAIRQWAMVPTLALFYAYRKDQAENDLGTVLFQISDHYALAQLGLGLIFRSTLSVYPHIGLPLGLDSSDLTFGLTLAYNFGSRRSDSRRR